MTILNGMRWCLEVVSIRISLIINNVEHIFMYLLWRNIYLVPLPIFCLGCWTFLYWARWTACIFWRLFPCKSHNFQMFSPILSFWSRKWQPTLVFLPGEFHRWRSLVGCGSWGRKESDTTEWPAQHISCPFIFIISFSV